MKAVIIFGCCMLISISIYSQQFAKTYFVELPDSAAQANLEWVDFDNDGLLDAFIFAALSSGDNFFLFYKTDTTNGFVNPKSQSTGFKAAKYYLTDFDQDNDVDIVLSGTFDGNPRTTFFENQGDFHFTNKHSFAAAGSAIAFTDLSGDGNGDLILSGTNIDGAFFNIYRFKDSWKLVHDSLKIAATSIEVFDFDGDSDNDLFVSGRENNLNVARAFINDGGLYFRPAVLLKNANGNTAVGDLNHDGRLDIFLTGVDHSGENVSVQYMNNGSSFFAKDTLIALSNSEVFLADFNSDGKCDVHQIGKNDSGDTFNVIALRDSVAIALDKLNLVDQAFGDYDRDGDLDVMQVSGQSSSLTLQVLRNDFASKNLGPNYPSRAFGFTIFNRMFLHWDRSIDDHTPMNSISYDVTLQAVNSELLIGEFDLISNKRLTVSHGNSGTRNYLLLKPQKISGFSYRIQSIDNAFESLNNNLVTGKPGVCVGSAEPCPSPVISEVSACKNEILSFTAEADARWFSLSRGLLADGAAYEMTVVSADTLFSFSPGNGCPSLKIYLINERTGVIKKPTETRFVCQGQTITLPSRSAWSDILWKSKLRGTLGSQSDITYSISQSDTVTLLASNGQGCAIERKTALQVSKPAIILNGEIFQILKGESVQLSASGADFYQWLPGESLDNSTTANPIASPLSTTIYTVSVLDSIGCSASANVQVIVEANAFVPTLFTPNDDGKNDELKVYGLAMVPKFSFVVHNREGNVLYETKDVSDVSNKGWDGTAKGVKQPAGIYYWKVTGEHPSGHKLLLNGKSTGSIVLIR